MLCKIQPEPENPIDSEAIAFKCKLDGQWHTIDYVVREVLKDVHEALTQNKVTNVSTGGCQIFCKIPFIRSC